MGGQGKLARCWHGGHPAWYGGERSSAITFALSSELSSFSLFTSPRLSPSAVSSSLFTVSLPTHTQSVTHTQARIMRVGIIIITYSCIKNNRSVREASERACSIYYICNVVNLAMWVDIHIIRTDLMYEGKKEAH